MFMWVDTMKIEHKAHGAKVLIAVAELCTEHAAGYYTINERTLIQMSVGANNSIYNNNPKL